MTLYEAKKGGSYCVEGLCVEPAITRRLQALGLNDGTIVNVLNRKKHGALIVQVRGTRLALGKHISSSIQVSEGGAFSSENEGKADGIEIHRIRAVGNLSSVEEASVKSLVSDASERGAAEGEAAEGEDESHES